MTRSVRPSQASEIFQEFFHPVTDRSFWCVRVIGYPALRKGVLGLSCGEHTDYGCWTILAQAGDEWIWAQKDLPYQRDQEFLV